MGTEGIYLNMIKTIYDKPPSFLMVRNRNESISPKIRNKTRMPTLTTLIKQFWKSWLLQSEKKKK